MTKYTSGRETGKKMGGGIAWGRLCLLEAELGGFEGEHVRIRDV